MNIKHVICTGIIAIVVSAMTSVLCADDLIRLLRPQTFSVPDDELTLQGIVEAPAPSRIEVEVQPFVAQDASQSRHYELDVLSGKFQDSVKLFPGINLLNVHTVGKQISVYYAVFLSSPTHAVQKNWGDESPIVFTQPRPLRVNTSRILLEGIVTSPDIGSIILLTLNNQHFHMFQGVDQKTDRPQASVKVHRIKVENFHFKSSVMLGDGHNIVLARPGDDPTPYAQVSIKSIVFERINPKITLYEPLMVSKKIIIKGKTHKTKKEVQVTIKVSALVKEKTSERLLLHTFSETDVQTDMQGNFSLEVPLTSTDTQFEIKDFPVIRANMGREYATKILLNWNQ